MESVPQVVSYPLPGLSAAGGNPILSGVLVDANLSALVQCQLYQRAQSPFGLQQSPPNSVRSPLVKGAFI